MNKTELIANVTEKTELTKKDVTLAIETFLEAITDALKAGERVALQGFGTFETRNRNARIGLNPKLLKELKEQGVPEEEAKNRAKVNIEAHKVPAFKPGKQLKETVK